MWKLLQYLIVGHVHKWNTVETLELKDCVYQPNPDEWTGRLEDQGKSVPAKAKVYTLRCEHCGNLKFEKVSLR